MSAEKNMRKIIHVDMDCFYAAIEIRDDPTLANKAVAVGGASDRRGVICTCNYVARRYGVHSAMATSRAYRQCPDLIVLPVNMPKYRQAAKRIHAIFREFTTLVEPLSLDEAYLDVTDATHCNGSATLIAQTIRERIWEAEKLTASAGAAPNKLLAKIASGWKKPNSLFVISPTQIAAFMQDLPVAQLWGVGKVTANKLQQAGFKTCTDLQRLSLFELSHRFGKLGRELYDQCRGIDHRRVEPNRVRKSLSVEHTFPEDLTNLEECERIIDNLFIKLNQRIQDAAVQRPIKNQYLKLKFSDFKQTTVEIANSTPELARYHALFHEAYARQQKPIRLLGLGVHFNPATQLDAYEQQVLF